MVRAAPRPRVPAKTCVPRDRPFIPNAERARDDMEVDFAFLADAADVSMGKLFVLGGAFDTIHVASFPATHPILAVVLRLLLSPVDLDRKHNLQILLLDADGKHIASANGELTVPKAPGSP